MTGPVFLYCIGAAQSGVAELHDAFQSHADVGLRAVRELHYFDTFDPHKLTRQLARFRGFRDRFRRVRAEAEAAGRGWQIDKMDRQIVDMNGLIAVLEQDRSGDVAYRRYVEGPGGAVVADMTPAYGLQSTEGFARMAAVSPKTRFLFLMRDPVARLWAHICDQAKRQSKRGEDIRLRAGRLLTRVIEQGPEDEIYLRGDYRMTIERLCAAVPEERVRLEFAERLSEGPGLTGLRGFLGLSGELLPAQPPPPAAAMTEDQRSLAARLLQPQYDFVAARLGDLPKAWRQSTEAATA